MSSTQEVKARAPYFDFSHLRGDLFGGLTAGIVALPLALAFGEASGAGPVAGLWGAMITGFFAALFGGTNTQITGPTGPMVVVFAGVFASLSGNLSLVFAAVVLAGIIQILFGVFRLGQYIRLVPYPVISGFMTGIGVIIILLQASRLFGHEPEGGGTIPALTAIPGAMADPNVAALALGLLTVGIVFLWPKKIGRFLPAPLAALIIGTCLASFGGLNVPILGDGLKTGLPSFIMPSFSTDTAFIVFEAAVILAALGAIDSLLTSLVADNMTRDRHESNRELIGQGIGNTVAGFFGAIPGAGATMRTVVNIKTGGRTRISGMVHGLILLAIVAMPFMAPLAKAIPHTVLAGILIKVGWDIVDVSYLRRAHKGPRWDLILMALVLVVTVFVDLITAVGIGVFLAGLAYVKSIADQQLSAIDNEEVLALTADEKAILDQANGRISLFEFSGPLSFGAAADLAHRVRERAGKKAAIILDFSRIPHLDLSAVRAVETVATDAHDEGKLLFVCGMNKAVADVLAGLNADTHIDEARSYPTRIEALRAAWGAVAPAADEPVLADGALPAT
ncbi:SulP family inorganic anion transporter [Parvularcula marina]|uniref:SulP family inorganic anion transporter n=1 Tax=Parvularcula marina TaxID=2292771 RepID=UPI003518C789